MEQKNKVSEVTDPLRAVPVFATNSPPKMVKRERDFVLRWKIWAMDEAGAYFAGLRAVNRLEDMCG